MFSVFKGVLFDEFVKFVDLVKEDIDVVIAFGVFAFFVSTFVGGAVNKVCGYVGMRWLVFINDEFEKNK